ncbi:hypothetical protein [Rhodanobacter lindaniclasticus]
MRVPFSIMLVATLLMAAPAQAQDLAATCHASSSYDVTLRPQGVLFDRPRPRRPRRTTAACAPMAWRWC